MKSVYTLLNKATIVCLVLGLALFSACKDDAESVPDYRVAFSVSNENPQAGEEVTFTNASTGGDSFEWTFGDGGTSGDKNPVYTYEESGAYTVTLMVDGFEELSATKDITVGDPVPVIMMSVETIEAGAEVVFTAEVYNPDGEELTYAWDFGATATGADLVDGMTTVAAPAVAFTEAGAVEVMLTVTLAGEELSTSATLDVKAQLAKTLIFTVVDYESGDGSLYWKKLYTGDAVSVAEDMNVPTASHPLTVRIHDNRVYVFDAGLGIAFSSDEAAEADGTIYSVDLDDPTDYVSIMDFAGGSGDYTTDPFFGDVSDTKIYFGDRRNGITAIDITTENATYTTADYPYWVANNQLGYYSAYRTDGGPTYGWGALNGSFYVRDNGGSEEFWWAKNSNHKGLWKFEAGDITDLESATPAVPALGGILTSEAVRAFEVDETNQKVYFSINFVNGTNEMGLYRADLDGTNIELIDDTRWHSEGGDSERTGITGIAVDAEGGYVYWGYRAPADADPEVNPLEVNSVKRWKIDGSGDVEIYVADVWVYGLAIDQVKK
ncbi:PKD domain-containing protein [Reichenbachiella agariperforans]|uniref:PKD domain-containing protein n=1 Tax=Reichenbachiella agariperforans TaxID=156994 RepID=A0A1M6Q3V4_REIAG|nr:PKD domain-containing protein [Reichenbachiella agariperforans]SHK14831.1 PKD domain-containing protein [Reichenbachiella agariperforans]